MSFLSTVMNLFRKGGAALGMVDSLGSITDDPRIAVPGSEYERINELTKYYKNDFKKITYKNSYGDVRHRQFQSVNMTKLASRRLASLIFNEKCKVNIKDTKTQQLLNDIFADNDFYNDFETHLEQWIALGDGCIRPYIQDDKIKFAWATADQVYPLKANTNEVNEIAIASVTQKTENRRLVYYTLLEFHEWQSDGTYKITNELYRSEDSATVGVKVPLNTLDEYAELSPITQIKGLIKPLFAFYKNPGANNKCKASPLGLGLIDNCKSTVDAINRTHDQFIWEVREGQRRVVVPKEWLKRPNESSRFGHRHDNDTHPPMFDADETVYQGMYGDASEIGFHDVTTDIRVQEYTDTMNYFLQEFENATGLSQGTFTNAPSGIQTATGVVSNNSTTYQTRSSYLTQVEKTIDALVDAILELASTKELFSNNQALWSGDISKLEINIDFNDGVFVDKESQRTSDLQAVQAGIVPKIQFLMRNYDLDENTAQKWLDQVQDEQSPTPPDQEMSMFPKAGDADSNDNDEKTESDDVNGANSKPDDGSGKRGS